MNSIERVKDLLSKEYPVFTVSVISDVASECGIHYRQALSFIDRCRLEGKSTKVSLQKLVFRYRPDLVQLE